MRPKIVISILLFVLALLAALTVPKLFKAEKPAQPASETMASSPNIDSPKATVAANKPSVVALTNFAPAVTAAVEVPKSSTEKIERLQSLAMNNDTDSLKEILAALSDSDAQVRTAAREAAVQFGDKSAAPVLRETAQNISDAHEKVALLEAADYLELPPLGSKPATNLPPKVLLP
jgi:hypothetical protein